MRQNLIYNKRKMQKLHLSFSSLVLLIVLSLRQNLVLKKEIETDSL
jgi:hypothetical protein